MKVQTNAANGELPATLHPEQRLKLAQVEALVGNGGTWIYLEIKAGRFPAPERDGPRNSRWRAGDVLDYLQARRSKAAAAPAPFTPPRKRKAQPTEPAQAA